ncbi:cytochrome c biogenesis protein CcsB [Peptococcaceae bacterium CEB3]|nr:cytochrome c biogenesis protein CcsB [Peptococcaceae bacterium CEB3]
MGREMRTGWGLVEEWLTSMKLGLILLGIIAVTAGMGTFIPQVDQSPQEAAKVGQLWQTLGLTQIYSTFWFRFLLGLLCLNLVACSVRRFNGIYGRVFRPRPPRTAGDLPAKIRTEIKGDYQILQDSVQRTLAHHGFRLTGRETETGWSFLGLRRRWGYWGSFLTHMAFVILVLGAFLSSLLGAKGYFMVGAGSTLSIQSIMTEGRIDQNFNVRVNAAEKKYLPNGQLDNWFTDLSLLSPGGHVLVRKIISVNHPLTYRGITFYQSDFTSGVHLTADVRGKEQKVLLSEQNGYNYYYAPGTDLYFVVAQIAGNEQQPEMMYLVYNNNLRVVQQGTLSKGQTANIQGEYKVTLDGYAPFTGIQVKKDPGVGVVWLGSALLLVGLFLSFYWRPARVAGVLSHAEETKEGILALGMTAGKGSESFLSEIRKSSEDV